MIELKKILVPTDCSEYSKPALRYAVEFMRQFKASCTLLTVADDRYLDFLGPAYFPEEMFIDIELKLLEQAEDRLKQFSSDLVPDDLTVELSAVRGEPSMEIIQYAKNNDIDMIIMGTHGHTGFSHILLGSVTDKIVRYSPCPVLTVKPDDHQFIPLP